MGLQKEIVNATIGAGSGVAGGVKSAMKQNPSGIAAIKAAASLAEHREAKQRSSFKKGAKKDGDKQSAAGRGPAHRSGTRSEPRDRLDGD